jgi:hypothetical protein
MIRQRNLPAVEVVVTQLFREAPTANPYDLAARVQGLVGKRDPNWQARFVRRWVEKQIDRGTAR